MPHQLELASSGPAYFTRDNMYRLSNDDDYLSQEVTPFTFMCVHVYVAAMSGFAQYIYNNLFLLCHILCFKC